MGQFEARRRSDYDAATTLIFNLSQSHEPTTEGICYYLDKAKSQAIRTNVSKKTIETASDVDEDIILEIKETLHDLTGK